MTDVLEIKATTESDRQMVALWKELTHQQKEEIVEYIRNSVQHEESTMSNEDIANYNKELEKGETEIRNNKLKTHDELMKDMKTWLSR